MRGLLLAAAHKSSGKTTVSIGLAAALRARGLQVQTFKKGPDFIDPAWLTAAAGRACRNLDPYLSPPEEISAQFDAGRAGADVALVEGNMALFDGMAADGADSNAALARQLAVPVVLVLDARGMTRSVAPLVLGYRAFDRDLRIAGVILNRVKGERHERRLREAIDRYTDVPVLGALREDPALTIEERHLGLVPAAESTTATPRIEAIRSAVAAQVDLDRLLQQCAPLPALPATGRPAAAAGGRRLRIGIARDRAFCFYYPEDLQALQEAGAALVPFDTLQDRQLPPIDALVIGGGFPEMLAAALAANAPLREQLRDAIDGGLPTYAECGGLMYLARSISVGGERLPMVGALPADVVMQPRPVGRGYVHLQETEDSPWPGRFEGTIRAHEFHHSRLVDIAPGLRYAYRVSRGHGIDGARDGIVHRNVLASYAHLRCAGGHNWAARFVEFARRVHAAGGIAAGAEPQPA
ncbi:MAG: cobyrinate a,c-diamide synthase [Burkholderiales bacterium]|nr:MAG: cobyrinate a,c-diamide synthase [Burkholderiales bacterium]